MIPPEQVEKIKEQLMAHIEKGFPNDKKEFAKNQVQTMDAEQLEAFLKQNNLVKGNQAGAEGPQGCIFCSIVSEQISSNKIGENKDAIAALEINPVSNGHTIIIPKEHVAGKENLPKSVFSLAETISNLIKTKLKPKKIETVSSNFFGHEIINVIPVYDSENIDSARSPAKPEELLELQKTLLEKKKQIASAKPKRTKIKAEKIRLPKRIP